VLEVCSQRMAVMNMGGLVKRQVGERVGDCMSVPIFAMVVYIVAWQREKS
jgi:hypothetical protein